MFLSTVSLTNSQDGFTAPADIISPDIMKSRPTYYKDSTISCLVKMN